jgi:hypothetical protein
MKFTFYSNKGTTVMKVSEIKASQRRYLQTATVKAQPIVATISNLEMETVGQGAEAKTKPVLYLENEKPIVLNASNLETLSDAFGDDTDAWPGHKIKVRCVKTQFQGKTVDGLRVEPIVPKPALKEMGDEITV